MTRIFVIRRGLIPFLIFFISCSSPQKWSHEVTHTWYTQCNSGRILFESKGLEMELVRGTYGERLYLNLKICPVPIQNPEDPKLFFEYRIDGEKFPGSVSVLQGGQRLLISDEDRNIIVQALKAGKSINLEIGMYDACILSEHFHQAYREIKFLPLPSTGGSDSI